MQGGEAPQHLLPCLAHQITECSQCYKLAGSEEITMFYHSI